VQINLDDRPEVGLNHNDGQPPLRQILLVDDVLVAGDQNIEPLLGRLKQQPVR
jgi:hypothetical protein